MPSDPKKDPKDPSVKTKGNKDKRGDVKDAPKERSVEEIDADIWERKVKDSLGSHGGWLGSLVLQSGKSGVSPSLIPMLVIIAFTLLILLIALPPAATRHMSALVTLLIPLQNTLRSISQTSKAKDSSQWLAYWVFYTFLGMVGGWIGVVRPHWKWIFEIWKTVMLVVLVGPWFGRGILLPEKTSLIKERTAAEERKKKAAKAAEAEAVAKANKEEEKRRKEKEKRDKEKAKEKEKREKEKAKEREKRDKEKVDKDKKDK